MTEKIRIEIGGMEYVISSDRDQAFMQGLAKEISQKLDELLKKSPYLSTTMAALLIALDCKENEQKALEAVEDAKAEARLKAEMLECAHMEIDEARLEIERLGRELRSLRNGYSNL